MANLSDHRLLIVSHHYNRFVKDQVDELAGYYDSVTVLLRYNRFATLSRYVPINYLKRHSIDTRLNRENQPENVTVIPIGLFYFPTQSSRRRLGSRHNDAVKDVIEERGIDFDLIHSHLTWTAGYVGQCIAERHDAPHVLTVHENPNLLNSHLEWDNEDLYDAWRSADRIVRVSDANVGTLEQFNDNVVVIPNGYDVDRFEPIPRRKARRHLGIDPDDDLLFSLGDLIERKGFHHAISLLPDLTEDREITYAIGGHGPKQREYRKLAAELEVKDRLRLLGYVPDDELRYWLSAADLFVFPSHAESFGVVQLEALACGTPVVAARNDGSETVISSDDVGILFDDPTDRGVFLSAVERGLERDWSRDAIVKYADQFTIPAVCEELVTLHSELLDEALT
ncbi:glycosyltransferase [Salinarchaeum laminariae]|uniref:glycosyltransferase n=1 Tax=Salinarchaeum laminariae TaxID=869888 RepID=UPI0020BD585B|nr:glycosyltransferase [Salinarchaeum laminariae]